jgi:hypothetical protein
MPASTFTFESKATAALGTFTDGAGNPVPGFDQSLSSTTQATGTSSDTFPGLNQNGITSSGGSVEIVRSISGSIYTLTVKATINNLNIRNAVTADRVFGTLYAEYHADWGFEDTAKQKRPRILPGDWALDNLMVWGHAYGPELQLPAQFSYTAATRQDYLSGNGADQAPVDITSDLSYPRTIDAPGGVIEVSSDTRRIRLAGVGVFYFAGWRWVNGTLALPVQQAIKMLDCSLVNPGDVGTGGVTGGGEPA